VVSITGNGLKTQEALYGKLKEAPVINARLQDFDELLGSKGKKVYTATGT
jgi:hypothetical protein